MPSIREDLKANLTGLTVIKSKAGVGSMFTIGLAEDIHEIKEKFSIWIRNCSWRVETGSEVLLSCEFKNRINFEKVIGDLHGDKIESLEFIGCWNDFQITFESGKFLKTFATEDEKSDYVSYNVFMPGSSVLTVGPGSACILTHKSMK